jgi:hypothetical protein
MSARWDLVSFTPVAPGWVVEYDDGRQTPLAGYVMARIDGVMECHPVDASLVVGHDWGWLLGDVRRPRVARIYPHQEAATAGYLDVVFTAPPGGPTSPTRCSSRSRTTRAGRSAPASGSNGQLGAAHPPAARGHRAQDWRFPPGRWQARTTHNPLTRKAACMYRVHLKTSNPPNPVTVPAATVDVDRPGAGGPSPVYMLLGEDNQVLASFPVNDVRAIVRVDQ